MTRYSYYFILIGVLSSLATVGGRANASNVKTLSAYASGKKAMDKSILLKLLVNRKISRKEARRYSERSARRLRNTIFALKGAKFKSSDLRQFFAKQKWYKGTKKPTTISLGAIAKRNVRQLLTTEAIHSSMSTFSAPWPLEAHFLGRKKDPRVWTLCMRFQSHDVIRTRTYFIVQKKAKVCRIQSSLRIMRISKGEYGFGGFAKGHLMLRRFGSSDIIDLRIYDVRTKKVAFKQNGMSPLSAPSFEKSGFFTYWGGSKMPKQCIAAKRLHRTVSSPGFNAWTKVCWPHMQKLHTALKMTPRPLCRCRDLGPYLLYQRKIPLSKMTAPPTLTGKASCGCSS